MGYSLVTSNKHKYEEMQSMFQKKGIELKHYSMKYPEMQASTIQDVALQSATTLKTYIREPFIIEDSGIEIDALNGFPGPYSSYVFQTIGWKGILKLMKDITNEEERKASFYSVIVLVENSKAPEMFVGKQLGKISFEGRGNKGFGFDPIFIPEGKKTTYAEMELHEKNKFSHRGKSTEKLLNYLIKNI